MEQLDKLKRRLNVTQDRDCLLFDLLLEAQEYVKGYTGRRTLPVNALDGVIVELAAGSYNRLGLESSTSHSQGGVSDTFEGLPGHLKKLLDMYRVAKVGGR